MKKYTIGMLVSNQFGVLTRISSMFSRRGFNIDSLVVGVTEDPALSRMTITMTGEDADRDQILKQLEKLHDVHVAKEMIPEGIVSRELILLKVNASSYDACNRIIQIANIFRASIIDVSTTTLTIAMIGDASKAEAIIDLVKEFGVLELVRTGMVALERGADTIYEATKEKGEFDYGKNVL